MQTRIITDETLSVFAIESKALTVIKAVAAKNNIRMSPFDKWPRRGGNRDISYFRSLGSGVATLIVFEMHIRRPEHISQSECESVK